jgi:hypothetical protein
MPNKKQSARSAESGWLLGVGVMGINKTLQLLRKGFPKFELIQVERLLRNYTKVKRGSNLPYLIHAAIPPYESMCVDLITDTPGIPKQLTIPGGFDEFDEMAGLINKDERKKRVKGAGPYGSSRAPLDRWILDDATAGLILDGPRGDSDKGRRLKTIKAHSLLLKDVVEVISGRKKSLPKRYPKEIEKELRGNARRELEEILHISLSVPGARLEHLRAEVAHIKRKIVLHDIAARELQTELFTAEMFLKKWESVKPINT